MVFDASLQNKGLLKNMLMNKSWSDAFIQSKSIDIFFLFLH